MSVLSIKLFNSRENNSFPFLDTFSSSDDASLDKHSVVLGLVRSCSAVQNQSNFLALLTGVPVSPAAFDVDETVLHCFVPSQLPKTNAKPSGRKIQLLNASYST